MKTNLKITLIGVFSTVLGVLALVIYPIEESKADVGVEVRTIFPMPSIGTKKCVCKHGGCYDQNLISFRRSCGKGSGTDESCKNQYKVNKGKNC